MTREEIEQAASNFLIEMDKKYNYIEQANMPNILSNEAFHAGAEFALEQAQKLVERLKVENDREQRLLRSTISRMNTEHIDTFRQLQSENAHLKAECEKLVEALESIAENHHAGKFQADVIKALKECRGEK